MILFEVITTDFRRVLVLGLPNTDMKILKEGRSIMMSAEEVGSKVLNYTDVIIMRGDKLAALEGDLKKKGARILTRVQKV